MARKSKEKTKEIVGLIGVGFDNDDGHQPHITKGDEFVILGGSETTHERLQDVIIHVTETLKTKGKRLRDAEIDEIIDLTHDAMDR